MMESIFNIVLLVLGFGFVIFFHELGHFLAAKWCDVRVEQFAVGFGHALLSWRKGLGLRVGTSGKQYEQIIKGEAPAPANLDPKQIGETEYRLNWIPLGGYVKMLGQDDMRPNAVAEDPRAYNKKSISQRMIIVSAGVVMNVILAAIGFMILFMIGFNVPPSVVGAVFPGSPAQRAQMVLADGRPGPVAPLQPGDRILMFDGKYQLDFTKISLNTALAEEGKPTLIYVQRAGMPEGQGERLYITPERDWVRQRGFLSLGFFQPQELRGPKALPEKVADLDLGRMVPAQALLLKAGDTIAAIEGEPVEVQAYSKFDRALQESGGKPVQVTIRDEEGRERTAAVQPVFQEPFDGQDIHFGGMLPRPRIDSISEGSSALGKLLPGDVVTKIADADATLRHPTTAELMKKLNDAGRKGTKVTLTVMRDGQEQEVADLSPSMPLGKGKDGATRYGLGVGLRLDELNPVVADAIAKSPAAAAEIPRGARIESINGEPVSTWHDVRRLLVSAGANVSVTVVADGESYTMALDEQQIGTLAGYRYVSQLAFHELQEARTAANPLQAMQWGAIETRDFILQFYLTLQRMFQGSVSYKNMMGPVGIFSAGTHFAEKGPDWLIWFLAMISANLAVVNFLPIPIVDGGLFTFLIIEKIQGRPLSARTQSIAQIVGLAVILGVFLLVTYQDIARLGGY